MGYDSAKKLASKTKEEKVQREKREERQYKAWLNTGRKIMREAIATLSSYHNKSTPQGKIKVKILGRSLLDKTLRCSIQSGTKRQFSQVLFDLRLVSENIEDHDPDMGHTSYTCWTFRNTTLDRSVTSFSGIHFEDALDEFMAEHL